MTTGNWIWLLRAKKKITYQCRCHANMCRIMHLLLFNRFQQIDQICEIVEFLGLKCEKITIDTLSSAKYWMCQSDETQKPFTENSFLWFHLNWSILHDVSMFSVSQVHLNRFLFNDIAINSANNRIIWCCRKPIWCNLNWYCFWSFSTLTITRLWFHFDSHRPFNGTIDTFLTIENYLQRNVSIKFTEDNNKWNISSKRLLNFTKVFNFWHFFLTIFRVLNISFSVQIENVGIVYNFVVL